MLGVNQEGRNLLFVINKYAGLGYPSELERAIGKACDKNQTAFSIQYTQRRGHATELSGTAAQEGFDRVIAVGGDGTINEVAQGLLNSPVPMGIVPRGSGNGLGRHLGIPLKTTDAINAIFDSEILAMDIFTVNGKLSLNVSGLGFDGHITNLFGIKSTRGFIGYITLTIQEFFKFREFNTTITTESTTLNRNAFIIAIANSSQYGNNALIAPLASVCDGLLHINILRKVPLYRLDFIYAFFSGKLEQSSFCEIIETKSVEISTASKVAFHVDGEACGEEDTFSIKLYPAALRILHPNNGTSRGRP